MFYLIAGGLAVLFTVVTLAVAIGRIGNGDEDDGERRKSERGPAARSADTGPSRKP